MKKIKGDLIQSLKRGEFDIIIHGCNCFNTMGSGLAKQLRDAWPGVYEVDCETISGDRNKLGSFTVHRQSFVNITCGQNSPVRVIGHVFYIINAYTQYQYGRGRDNFEYGAFQTFLYSFKNYIELMYHSNIRKNETGRFTEEKVKLNIGFPMIGAGLAGGDWIKIEAMIEKFSESVLKVANITIVEYQN